MSLSTNPQVEPSVEPTRPNELETVCTAASRALMRLAASLCAGTISVFAAADELRILSDKMGVAVKA